MIDTPNYYPCPLCRGSGDEEGEPCPVCDECGLVRENETLTVGIPPMPQRHQRLELPLRGLGLHNF
jgi:DnaJ-class molecular chaperone